MTLLPYESSIIGRGADRFFERAERRRRIVRAAAFLGLLVYSVTVTVKLITARHQGFALQQSCGEAFLLGEPK